MTYCCDNGLKYLCWKNGYEQGKKDRINEEIKFLQSIFIYVSFQHPVREMVENRLKELMKDSKGSEQ